MKTEPIYKIVDGVVTVTNKEDVEFTRRLFNVRQITNDGCWRFTNKTTQTGHGQIRINGKRMLVNRASYEHFIGPIPYGSKVAQTCKHTSCFNPEHLYLEDMTTNLGDSWQW